MQALVNEATHERFSPIPLGKRSSSAAVQSASANGA